MIETGTIKSIQNDMVIIGCGDAAACSSCGGSAFCSVKERTIEAINRKALDLAEGDTVNVFIPPGQAVFAAFMVMILPLILFMVFFMASGKVIPDLAEGIKVLFGLIGLAGGFLSAFLYSQATKKTRVPEVVSKL
ncbi:MAG: SoxR reducing system RseC family protein [Spirochaetales bacterium]|nr:SoxR reducing system RseC family protein [Spirochaetales bacterium]